jgi:prophage regulatory protein
MQHANFETNQAPRQPNQEKSHIHKSRRFNFKLPSPITEQSAPINGEKLLPSLALTVPLEKCATVLGEAVMPAMVVNTLATTLSIANQCKVVILRLKEVQARIGLGRSAIYYLMDPRSVHHDPEFPRSVKLSAHAVGWIEAEIDAWLQSRITESRS